MTATRGYVSPLDCVPADLAHLILRFPLIDEVCAMRRLSTALRDRIRALLVDRPWNVVFPATSDGSAHVQMVSHLARQRVCRRCQHSHRDFDRDNASDVLRFAAEAGMTRVVKTLLTGTRNGFIDVAARDWADSSALEAAVFKDHVDVVEVILRSASVDFNLCDDVSKTGETVLHVAAELGRVDMLRALVAWGGFDVNALNSTRWTPLLLAIENRRFEVVDTLLALSNVDAGVPNDRGQTPMHFTANTNNINVVRALLARRDVDPSARDCQGNTPLHSAASKGCSRIVEVLLADDRVDRTVGNLFRDTPLDSARRNGHRDVVTLLRRPWVLQPWRRFLSAILGVFTAS